MRIKYKTRDSWGNVWHHVIENVHSWIDETCPYDPYTLRVMRDEKGRVLGGPMVGEFTEWQEESQTSQQ